MNDKDNVIYPLRMPREMRDKMTLYCRDKDIPATQLIRTFIKTWIKEQDRLKAIEMKNLQAVM